MQLTANLVQILPVETGMGRNGEWKKQSIILETDGQYPKKVCITAWGDKINAAQLQLGKRLTVDFDLESREYNGRWYTDVKAWKVMDATDNPPAYPSSSQAAPLPPVPPASFAPPAYTPSDMPPEPSAPDDLPF
jgi:hypothetical protein